MKIRNSFVEKFPTVTAVSRVREVGDSELSNICGQQSSVSLLCVVCSCAQAAAAVKLFSRKKISYMNDISFWPAALTLLVTTTELPTYLRATSRARATEPCESRCCCITETELVVLLLFGQQFQSLMRTSRHPILATVNQFSLLIILEMMPFLSM